MELNSIESLQKLSAQSTTTKTKSDFWWNLFSEVSAILFWAYLLSELLFFNLDGFILSRVNPTIGLIIEYKFFIILGLFTLIFIFTKSISFIFYLIYVLFYPFMIVFWKIPKILFKSKSWNLTFAFINTAITFFKSFKFNLVVFSGIAIFSIFILATLFKPLILISIIILPLILIVLYVYVFSSLFKSSVLYDVYDKVIKMVLKYSTTQLKADATVKDLKLSEFSTNQLQAWTGNLQILVMVNKGIYYLSSKLRDYQKNRFNIVFYVINFLLLIFITIWIFGVGNLGIQKINPNAFSLNAGHNFFIFVYYSFNSLFNHGIFEVTPIATFSRIYSMLELFYTLLLVVLLFSLFVNIKPNKDSEEIKLTINQIEVQGRELAKFIESEYKMTIDDAVQQLADLKAGLIRFIYFLSGVSSKKDD